MVLEKVKTTTLPEYMPLLEKCASQNGTGFLVGDGLTIADLSVVEALLIYVEYLGQDIFDGYPAMKKMFDTVTSVKSLATYLNGPKRPKKNDEAAIARVIEVLDFKI